MNLPLRPILSLTLLLALAAGCKRKPDVAIVAEEREAALPVEERAEPVALGEPGGEGSGAPKSEETKVAKLSLAPDFAAEAQAFEAWCAKFRLDPRDSKMLDADPDGDGFPNREEFIGGTDPLDAKSRPGIHSTMRLQRYNEVRLPVVLESVSGGKARIKSLEDDSAKAPSVKAGDTVPGLSYKVERVEEKHDTDKGGNPIDISHVTLEDPATRERVTLVKGMPARTPATFATLVSDDGKTTINVRQGDTFEWPAEPGAHYKVVDMSEDQVVVQHLETRKMWTVVKE